MSHSKKRLEKRFAQLRQSKQGGLVTFITAGDPDLETSQKILQGLPNAGADIIELGMPFSDPMADGPAIQLANIRALDNGATLSKTLNMVSVFRQQDDETPLVLMGYFNPIHYYGVQKFLDDALSVGVDGLIIVDLPPEEDDELCHPSLTAGINWIRLTTPTSDKCRLASILKNSSGFVYHVSITGITGTNSADYSDIESAITRIKSLTDLPIAVGFGIKTPELVHETTRVADAAVVGSALVNVVARGKEQNASSDEIAQNVCNLVTELATGKAKKL